MDSHTLGGPAQSANFQRGQVPIQGSRSSGTSSSKQGQQTGVPPGQGQSSSNDTSPTTAPISLPKGGGEIRAIGEKFNVNANTGSASLTVPISLSKSRAHTPELSLIYSPGNGNGPFGMGWQLSQTAITRKTDKGLPLYRDNNDDAADMFLADGDDLVPIYRKDEDGNPILLNGQRQYVDTTTNSDYSIRTYMHRVERNFSRIERWTNVKDPSQIHWRKITKDNSTFIYGLDNQSRIYDSTDQNRQGGRIFTWLLSESYDVKGNSAIYIYKREDLVGVAKTSPSEINRHANRNCYLKAIKYGNRIQNRDPSTWAASSPSLLPDLTWMFSVIFDYGEHDANHPTPSDSGNWRCRQDPFSSYRARFEIRTYRFCQRILMFHHFPDPHQLAQQDVLVSSMNFTYAENPNTTYLTSIAQFGYLLNSSGSYQSKCLPPLDLKYSKFPTNEQLSKLTPQNLDPQSLRNIPQGVDGSTFQWIDLDGEGLAGIFSQAGGAAFYKHNLSNHARDGKPGIAKFGPIETLCSFPNVNAGEFQFMDLAGDGQVDVVYGHSAFSTRTDNGWSALHPFQSFPNIDFDDPRIRFVDLTGNGLADIIILGDQVFTWYQSAGYKGHRNPSNVLIPFEKSAPRIVFADKTEKMYFADMTGDGLSDIVRIRNGSVCYWPNLGYASFGGMVTMGNAPFFDFVGSFNPKYLLLADVDGSGTTDILYLRSTGVAMYLNQSGNSFMDGKLLPVFPPMDSLANVDAVDLFGMSPSVHIQ
jgi:hypothetical protein